MRALRLRRFAPCVALLLLVPASRGAEPVPAPSPPPAVADSVQADAPVDDVSASVADTSLVDVLSPDSLTAVTDSTAVADSASAPLWYPHPARRALRTFRLERSVDVDRVDFGDRSDPVSPPGLQTLGDALRLEGGFRLRQFSQGPTAESFAMDGGSSTGSNLMLRGRSLGVPGTSGPHSHEIAMSEIGGFAVVRDGAAALFGPDAVDGAVLAEARHPVTEELLSRFVAEEGVDQYQRAAFHIGRRVGSNGSFFLSTEARRVEGFFPGTKEVDRQFAGTWIGQLPNGWEFSGGYRRWEGDGRSGEDEILSVLTKRGDYHAEVFRPQGNGRGLLAEAMFSRQRIETNVGSPDVRTREVQAPGFRGTWDLPTLAGWDAVARVEGTRWRIQEEETTVVDHFWRGATALRVSRGESTGRLVSATARLDSEEDRKRAVQARLEGSVPVGVLTAFAVASRGERVPPRGADGSDNQVHDRGTVGLRMGVGGLRMRGAGFAEQIQDYRREPTIEEIRAKTAVLDAPLGDATIHGATGSLETDAFRPPGLGFLGHIALKSSVTWLDAELEDGSRLPRRARITWSGEGLAQRRFFKDELLARVRGRLTHLHDRVDEVGDPVLDAWVTDVLLEGEIGDVVFFYRFHDLLERADEIEPGIRLPGFSRMYGISWRFWG